MSCSVWPPSLLEAAFFFCYSSTALAGGYSCVTLTLTLTLSRICDKCAWHSIQDEEHNLLDCPHELLVSLRTQHCQQLVFPSQYEDSPLNQPDLFGVASFVAKCQALFP